MSPTSIERVAQHRRQVQRERERQELLRISGGEKEGPTTVEIDDIVFDATTRIAKIVFIETKNYRTVDRYVTQNYVRYPILSGWKKKSKKINKTVKLTNLNLEYLNVHSDPYISNYAFDIISKLNNEEMYPRWYLLEVAELDKNSKIEQIEKNCKDNTTKYNLSKNKIEEQTRKLNVLLAPVESKLSELTKSKNSREKYLLNATSKKVPLILTVLSVGVFNLFKSAKIKLFKNSIIKIQNKILELQQKRDSYLQKIEECNVQLKTLESDYKKYLEEHQKITKQILDEYNDTISKITSLEINVPSNSNYVPLKKLAQFEYSKIVGCYVIRNTINGRCYVGQSKDVLKRLKQHFKGTQPANIIFAEDYYDCEEELRESLFEFMIIECSTKDQLDSMEKQLIEEHLAFKTGYNSTAGNA